ncbi:Aldo/keto reductase [Neolentinus lepideus HHB14362 ss-1]|uniref:Aldo/keto reductase n=1 Tax=Neolentinus lepideus HHB14362 ss-1 TaxID=1314782 RepID=A0A165MLJ7_9AGAM|nr:Aldo/keto reductase [Neolentinus lepideus HHB14362 ss-1]
MATEQVKIEFDPKGMPFRRLGSSGLRVPVFSLGGWLTLGGTVVGDPEIIKVAYENGINMFDTAETYAKGKSEIEMGRVIKELGLRRTDLIISTKIFWGPRDGPNDKGLSRKHIIEGTRESLARLQLDYVDILFAHRYDVTVPMEEVVRAFSWVIDQGWAYYWATSEWSARDLEEAIQIADKLGLHKPVAEQCQHNMFHRERPEKEYAPTHLALAWVAKNPNTSTVILGASRPEQVVDNLQALAVIPKLTPEILAEVEEILGNRPEGYPTYGRPALDAYGRDPIF